LPAEPTSFVGRRAELARLLEVVGARRLVTVTGVGGVGKTRLVRQVARSLAGSYPDGVCLVELSSLQGPGLLANTVGTALGLAGLKGRQALDAVHAYLRGRSMLLILDTCEHLVTACGEFALAALNQAPGVSILATSRQPLGVRGERTFPLLPLPVPEDGSGPSAGDAVDLFVQRAATVAPDFTLNDGNRADVISLCRRLRARHRDRDQAHRAQAAQGPPDVCRVELRAVHAGGTDAVAAPFRFRRELRFRLRHRGVRGRLARQGRRGGRPRRPHPQVCPGRGRGQVPAA
jgi:predicted ATPase